MEHRIAKIVGTTQPETISSSLEGLEFQVNSLAEALGTLEKKLAPVTRPAPCDPECASLDLGGSPSSMNARIQEISVSVYRLQTLVEQLTNNCDI